MHAERILACAERYVGLTLSDLRGDLSVQLCLIPVTKPRRMPELKILEKESNLENMNEIMIKEEDTLVHALVCLGTENSEVWSPSPQTGGSNKGRPQEGEGCSRSRAGRSPSSSQQREVFP